MIVCVHMCVLACVRMCVVYVCACVCMCMYVSVSSAGFRGGQTGRLPRAHGFLRGPHRSHNNDIHVFLVYNNSY